MNKFDYFKVLHRAYALTILENSMWPVALSLRLCMG